MLTRNGTSPPIAHGDRWRKTAGWVRIGLALTAVAMHATPAHAAIWDPVLDFLDETTLAFEQVVGGFILLAGLVVAWVVAVKMQSVGAGFMVAVAVIAFAGMVGNHETLATELGFGGGGGGGGRGGR